MMIFVFGSHSMYAQDAIKIVTNHPDFKIKVKRCAASGKTVVLDLTLSNVGANDIEGITAYGNGRWTWSYAEAYDDEGNIYGRENIKVKVANKPDYRGESGEFNIPVGVPIRLSIQINNVAPTAESLARFKIVFTCTAWGLNGDKPVKISNIPISRD